MLMRNSYGENLNTSLIVAYDALHFATFLTGI